MKLSTRSRYGLRLMLALGASEKKGPVFLREIARAEGISEKYLSQIIIPLKAKGLVTTFRGAHGGYLLGRPASEIRLREIIEPLEGDLCLVDCVANATLCGRSTECVTRDIWKGMDTVLTEYLDSVTLEDLVQKYNLKRRNKGAVEYSI